MRISSTIKSTLSSSARKISSAKVQEEKTSWGKQRPALHHCLSSHRPLFLTFCSRPTADFHSGSCFTFTSYAEGVEAFDERINYFEHIETSHLCSCLPPSKVRWGNTSVKEDYSGSAVISLSTLSRMRCMFLAAYTVSWVFSLTCSFSQNSFLIIALKANNGLLSQIFTGGIQNPS